MALMAKKIRHDDRYVLVVLCAVCFCARVTCITHCSLYLFLLFYFIIILLFSSTLWALFFTAQWIHSRPVEWPLKLAQHKAARASHGST